LHQQQPCRDAGPDNRHIYHCPFPLALGRLQKTQLLLPLISQLHPRLAVKFGIASEAGYHPGRQLDGCILLTGVSLGSSKVLPLFIFASDIHLVNVNSCQLMEIQTNAFSCHSALIILTFCRS
jgi:hypothetical protein